MTTRILFVCLGNICRSPAAEGVMRKCAPHLSLDSAGTSDWHVGEPPYPPMQRAAQARGYDLSTLRARQFRAADFAAFDLILAMDENNLAGIESQRPPGSTTPVRLFAAYADPSLSDVPDPYYTRDFDGVLTLIEKAARGLLRTL
ncbi:low molecular weight protein-tyrosine-phosphatase [Thalassovita sp.]|uniref:low molecular weight protein-tyrosine-phosphatase n=1 Tax=Thalassovita sp. TaxID=1979401 RepID=UPI0029DE61CE|nr:low molecular weight protein-tyrosine-phosphatase [Thalassovita sp.]